MHQPAAVNPSCSCSARRPASTATTPSLPEKGVMRRTHADSRDRWRPVAALGTRLRGGMWAAAGLLGAVVSLSIAAGASADQIAFNKPTEAEPPGKSSIWIADAGTGEGQTKIPNTERGGWPALSPTGTQVAFVPSEGFQLDLINTDGSGKRVLASAIGGQSAWSPDGKSIVFEQGFPQHLEIVNVSTGAVRALGGEGRQIYPCWSRDGRYIAFESFPEEGHPSEIGLYYMNADGSGSMQAIHAGKEAGSCSFGAGDIVAFDMHPPPRIEEGKEVFEAFQAYTAHLDGSGLRELTTEKEGGGNSPRWNKQGTKLAFNRTTSIWTMNPDGSGQAPLLKAEGSTQYFEPSLEEPYLFSVPEPQPEELLGSENPGAPEYQRACAGKPVNCATGNEAPSQTDVTVDGRGVGLDLTRTYNAQTAVAAKAPEPFGRGWTATFSDHLVFNSEASTVEVVQANGSAVFFKGAPGTVGAYAPPEWVRATMSLNSEHVYIYTLPNQKVMKFNEEGRLLSEADRNGNATTLAYNTGKQLETATDPVGRKLTFAYNGEGFVESVKDPMGRTVKYAYEGGNLASVIEPGETLATWQFKYDGTHRLTELTDGRGGITTNEYDGSNRVISQSDPLGRTMTFEYAPSETKITNHVTGAVTKELFTKGRELESITRAYGTGSATTENFTYDEAGAVMATTDGNGHTTEYAYNGTGDRTKMVDANGHETKWSYDSTHDVVSTTTPKGETTTIKRDSHGNAEVVERPAPAGKTQATKYKYASNGDLESVTDPLEHTTKYEYNSHGDRTVEVDAAGDKRTWGYDEDSQQTLTTSPRGNVEGGEPSKYTTKTERDAQERPIKVTDPLGHETTYAYDADGNIESTTDALGHTAKYTYDADNELTKTERAGGATSETGYDGAGEVTSQTDGNKHTTKYARNVLEQVIEVEDPLKHKTSKEYDKAGNLTVVTDPLKRKTTFTYDAVKRLKEIAYSDGKTHSVLNEYDADGERTKMVDGTGTTTLTYDQLDRLTESKDGHGDVVKYEYDLANQLTKITYPNGKPVTRAYDNAGRLQKVTDWLEHVSTFGYDPDSNQASTTWPAGTSGEDTYAYNEAEQMKEIKMLKGAETLASLVYTRDGDGRLKEATSKGLPGEEKAAYEYDVNSRLTRAAGVAYEYDAADNPTKTGSSTNTFNAGNELEKSGSTTYAFDEADQRTKMTPAAGAATTYTYDEAGNLAARERPKEGKIAGITDAYTYDGTGLRMSETIAGTKAFFAWQAGKELPLLLNDGANSYIYGPGGLPIEQISSTGTVLYLHHDQQGSTRMLTSTAGKAERTATFDGYGESSGTTGTATTPLGYDGQYTSSDSGFTYLRSRTYDPATSQFLTADPFAEVTREQYEYAGDNPVTFDDPTGLFWKELGEGVLVGLSCLGGPEVCGPVGLAVINAHVAAADIKSGITGCSPWHEIAPALVGGGVGLLPFGVGAVARRVWEASRGAYRLSESTAVSAGTLAGIKTSASSASGCSC